MLTFLGIIVLVIFVHELGHYLAARAMGGRQAQWAVRRQAWGQARW